MITRIPAVQFTYEFWRAGSLNELGIRHREWAIRAHIRYIKEMAIGFTEAEKLHVRPKKNCIAVMFFAEGKHFWTHLTTKEFLICFPELRTYIKNTENLSI